jgi:hypothetical protein
VCAQPGHAEAGIMESGSGMRLAELELLDVETSTEMP